MFLPTFWRSTSLAVLATLVCASGMQTAKAQSLFGGSSAQSRGGTSSTGGVGTQLGSSSGLIRSTSPTAGFTSSFGSTSQAGALNSGFGGAGAGGAGASGQTGMTGPAIATELGSLSATAGQGGFIGRADNAGRFVGNQTASQQSIQGTNTPQFGNRGQGGNNQQNNFNQQTRRTIRPQQKIAFQFPARAQAAIQTNLSTQFQRLQTGRPELQGVEVQLAANSEVVLRGAVPTEDDKKLAAMLARMEPGVRSVKNELTIQGN